MLKKLFRRSVVTIEMMDALSYEWMGEIVVNEDQLPSHFKQFQHIHLDNKDWEVVKAVPVLSDDFKKTGELKLWLKPRFPNNGLYAIPSIAASLPAMSLKKNYPDFTLTLHEDEWKQMELVSKDLLPTVQEEMSAIETILFPEDDPHHDSTEGFARQHTRSGIHGKHLSIPEEEFCRVMGIREKGNIEIYGKSGFVENGFAFRSAGYNYYGIIEESMIRELSVHEFESMDDEIAKLMEAFNLLFVCWCRGSIASG